MHVLRRYAMARHQQVLAEWQGQLFVPPLHEFVADTIARELQFEFARKFQQLRDQTNERFDSVRAFRRRSVAMRRRILRYRQNTGVTA